MRLWKQRFFPDKAARRLVLAAVVLSVAVLACSDTLLDPRESADIRLSVDATEVEGIDAFDVIVTTDDGETVAEEVVSTDEETLAVTVPSDVDLTVDVGTLRETPDGTLLRERYAGSDSATVSAGEEATLTVALELVEPEYADGVQWVGDTSATTFHELQDALDEAAFTETDDDEGFVIYVLDDIVHESEEWPLEYTGESHIYVVGLPPESEEPITLDTAGSGAHFDLAPEGQATVVHIERLDLTDGFSDTDPGALNMSGGSGGAEFALHEVTVRESSGSPGAVVVVQSSASIVDSRFENNSGTEGGALSLSLAEVVLDEAGFSGNIAGERGGAVHVEQGGTLHVHHSTFEDNAVTGSPDEQGGGAISAVGTIEEISGSTFRGNSAEAEPETFVSGGAISANSEILLTDSHLEGNSSETDGGAVAVTGSAANHVEIEGSAFEGNSADTGHGGALFVEDAPVLVHDSVFDSNSALSETDGGDGGAVYIQQRLESIEEVAIIASEFVENDAGNNGGAIRVTDVEEFMILSSRFENHEAGGGGGAVSAGAMDGGLYIGEDTRFVGNATQEGDGGAVYFNPALDGHDVVIDNSLFEENYVSDGGGQAVYHVGEGFEGPGDIVTSDSTYIGNGADPETDNDVLVAAAAEGHVIDEGGNHFEPAEDSPWEGGE